MAPATLAGRAQVTEWEWDSLRAVAYGRMKGAETWRPQWAYSWRKAWLLLGTDVDGLSRRCPQADGTQVSGGPLPRSRYNPASGTASSEPALLPRTRHVTLRPSLRSHDFRRLNSESVLPPLRVPYLLEFLSSLYRSTHSRSLNLLYVYSNICILSSILFMESVFATWVLLCFGVNGGLQRSNTFRE